MARRAPLTAALIESMSNCVSINRRSTPPFEQAEGLLLVGVPELGVRDVPEGGELGAGAHGARHPARPLGRGELVADGAGQLGGPAGELAGAVGQPVLGQHDRGRAEGVGLDHVAADLEEGAVHLGHQVRARLDEPLVAPFELGPAEVVRAEAEQLQVRPHGAVEDDDPVAQRLQVRGGRRVEPTEEFGRGSHHPHRIPAALTALRNGAGSIRPDGAEDLHQEGRRRDDGSALRRAGAQGLAAYRAQRCRRRGPGRHRSGPCRDAGRVRGQRPSDGAGPRPLRADGGGGHRPGEPLASSRRARPW